MRLTYLSLLALLVVLSSSSFAAAEPPRRPGAPIIAASQQRTMRQPWRKRTGVKIRKASKRTAGAFRKLHEKTPAIVRHGAATLLFAGIACASAKGLSGQELMSVQGMLSTTGFVVGVGSTLRQGFSTLRCAFPRAMHGAHKRVQRSPLGPLVAPQRSMWQRLRGAFRRGPSGG